MSASRKIRIAQAIVFWFGLISGVLFFDWDFWASFIAFMAGLHAGSCLPNNDSDSEAKP